MRRSALLLLPLLALAGCKTVGPDFQRPSAAATATYPAGKHAKGAPLAQPGQGPQVRWWEEFGSPEINALVDRAIASNPTITASKATLRRARENANAAAGRLLPQVDARGQVQHEKINLSAMGFDASSFGFQIENPELTLFSVGAGVSYDLDLFGGGKRSREQALAEAEAQLRETEAAHLTIAGRVVMQALTIAALNDRIAAQKALIGEDERNLDLVDRKRRGGEGTMVEVLSAQRQLAADRTMLPPLEQTLAEARNGLAVLLGISPGELEATDWSLWNIKLPAQVPVALPSELVHKRPDILAAEARLHSATAAIGVATARLYPSVTLGASFTQMAKGPDDLFSGNANSFNLLGGITGPLFHGGSLKAGKRAAEAEAEAAAARYKATVLEAFGQVSNLLSALDNDARSVSLQAEAASVADRSLNLSRRSFQVGNSGVLQVLDASRGAEQARLALLDARMRQYLNVARLYVATAGGWSGEERN